MTSLEICSDRFIAVDVGNTSIEFACMDFTSLKILKSMRIPTVMFKEKKPSKTLTAFLNGCATKTAVISSVVPSVNVQINRQLSVLGIKALILGKHVKVRVQNLYTRPSQVGMDRLMNAVAAHHLFKRPCVVIDFGTAITFDVISAKGSYEGGVIAPGIEITLEALYKKTALLPKTRLRHPKRVVGRDTVDSIRSGCSYGIGGLCEGIIRRINQGQRTKYYVIATGGYARYMSKYTTAIDVILDDLVMLGISLSYRRHVEG